MTGLGVESVGIVECPVVGISVGPDVESPVVKVDISRFRIFGFFEGVSSGEVVGVSGLYAVIAKRTEGGEIGARWECIGVEFSEVVVAFRDGFGGSTGSEKERSKKGVHRVDRVVELVQMLRTSPSTCIQAVHVMCSWDRGRAEDLNFGGCRRGWRKTGGGCAVPGPRSRVEVGASTKSEYDREGERGERDRGKSSRRM